MAEKPMLFNTPMVRAILDGRKTQTRRLVKGLPLVEPWFTVEDGRPLMCDKNGDWYPAERFCRVQPGDILWVRETWAKDAGRFLYRADYGDTEKFHLNGREIRITWRPSIHMPREAARLYLPVKNVRMERLQAITTADAEKEGAETDEWLALCEEAGVVGLSTWTLREFFGYHIWNRTISGETNMSRYGWDANPWVWVYEFIHERGAC